MSSQNGDADDRGATISRDNHFIPRGLLKRWSLDQHDLYAYRLLVSHEDVPFWTRRSVSSVAMQRDLYTASWGDRDSDEFERWISREVEQPGIEASERLINNGRASRDDWHAIVRLYALQESRTPQGYVESMERWDKAMPALLEDTLQKAVAELKSRRRLGNSAPEPSQPNHFADLLNIEIHQGETPGEDGTLSAHVVAGRWLWLSGIRHILEGKVTEKLLRHTWSILIPAPLTDHPALRAGFRSLDDVSFQAGIRQRRADLMMPLSPEHLLHVEVGRTRRGFQIVSEELTRTIQSVLVKRAYRMMFASSPNEWMPRERPRRVDAIRFEQERIAWLQWHGEQSAAERRNA